MPYTPVTPISSKTGVLLVGKQTAPGTPATEFFQFKWLSGTPKVNKTTQTEEIVDGATYSIPTIVVDKVSGAGASIVVEADVASFARAIAWIAGNDTYATAEHTTTISGTNEAAYLTFVYSEGVAPAQVIRQFQDCRLSGVQLDGSSSQRIQRLTLDFSSLGAGQILTALPTVGITAGDPLTFQDASGSFIVNDLNGGEGVAYCKQFQLAVKRPQNELYGDSVQPYGLLGGVGQISFSATLGGNNQTIGLLNEYLYGTATPTAGTEPSATLLEGPFSVTYAQSVAGTVTQSLDITIGNAVYTVTEFEVKADASEIDIPAAGRARADSDGVLLTTVSVAADGVTAAY